MEQIFEWLKPAVLTDIQFAILISLSFVTSAVTALMGAGGGALLIAVMASFMPAAAIIPVHAVVQLGSNGGRLLLMRRFVDKHLVMWFVVGTVIGALIGGNIAVSLEPAYLQFILGGFILLSCWVPITAALKGKKSLTVLGALTSFLTMFVGATGPFVIASMRHIISDKQKLVGTMSALMSAQHLIKAVVFGGLGFAFADWLGLIVLMILTGFFGTMAGQALLERVSNEKFQIALRIMLTFLALRLLWSAAEQVML
ncbi:sulfite exporter TauE/SafE family protein [Photobacterium satsumensis]|uniref:sulfite exporter TauE/SafE family protein n=1 Tax=Photobacterium satsumensis TaxID=2910239 RepID=UPI003D13D545